MSPVKTQGRTNGTLKKAEATKKKKQSKTTKQNASKVLQPPCSVPNGKQKHKGNSPTMDDGTADGVKNNRRNKAGQSKKRNTNLMEKKHTRQDKNTLGNGTGANVRHEIDVKVKGGTKKTTKFIPSPKTSPTIQGGINNNKLFSKPKNMKDANVTESEQDESESSNSGNSEEVTEEEISSDEKEEEQNGNEEPPETQRSDDSSEEETEASDIQRDTEHTANDDSDEKLSEETKSTSDSEAKSLLSIEEEEENEKEIEVSEAVISEGDEDKEITQEDTCKRPATDKICRRRRQTSCPSKPAPKPKFKMFKRTKADKQTIKAEKQRVKAEKQRLDKEAKQKAKEEKKNKKKLQKKDKCSSFTEEIQPPKGNSLRKFGTKKGKIQFANKTECVPDEDPPAEADGTDLDEEEEEDEPILTKAIKGQNQIMLLKAKGKEFKPILETEKHENEGRVTKGRPQSLLLGKVKMASLRHKAKKIPTKPDEEISEGGTLDRGSSKLNERSIAQRKGMTALRRVSGWIQRYMPRGLNLKKKVSAWTKAIGVSHWLSVRAIKHKQDLKKSKGNILKHRMAMRVASKSSLTSRKNGSSSENKTSKENSCPLGKAGEGGEGGEVIPTGEKDAEAKYAVVLPRMNKLGKTAEGPQEASGLSTSSVTTGPPDEPITSEPKPPKPGARLVLPVKPDLSLLKSIKKPLPGGLTSGGDVAEGSPGSSNTLEASLNPDDRKRRTALENQDGVGVLQAARRKLDPSQINLTKMSLSGGTMGPTRAKEPDPEREAAVGILRSTTQPYSSGEAAMGMTGVRSLYEEEADREVAQLMGEGGIYANTQPEVHWTGNPRMSGNPQVSQ